MSIVALSDQTSTHMFDDLKQLMVVATLGISPADSILVKAYFRLILRLDYDIVWVSATDPRADILLINKSIVSFEKTQDFLSSLNIPVLQIVSAQAGLVGMLQGDTVQLPLTDTRDLQAWLFAHVDVLQRAASRMATSHAPTQKTETQPAQADYQIEDDLPQLIHQLKKTTHSQPRTLALYDQYQLRIGVADPAQQLFWPEQQGDFKIETGWSLKIPPLNSPRLPTRGTAQDLRQWLWQGLISSHASPALLNVHHLVQLHGWPKPKADEHRRDVLKVLACLNSQPMSAIGVSRQLQLPLPTVQRIMAALTASGWASVGAIDPQFPLGQSYTDPIEPAPTTGFRKLLTRLRQSLGL
ncbi:MAG: hypothetical protein VXW65_03480 [Pseudomonadota bacterium]|nr:hypothetical protein [Pseudomonadota bacterium]